MSWPTRSGPPDEAGPAHPFRRTPSTTGVSGGSPEGGLPGEGRPPAQRPARDTDSIRRNTGFAFAVQMTGAVFTAGLTFFLVRALGPYEYGLLALALGVGGVLLIPSDLGISQSAARFIAEHRGDRPAVAAILADALKLKVAVAVLVSGGLFAASGLIADAYGAPGLTWPLRAMALALLGHSFLNFLGTTFTAQGRLALHLPVVASESAVETGTAVALVLLGAGATGAALGRAGGYLFATGVGLALLARHVGRRAIASRGGGGANLRRLVGYAGAMVVIDGAFTLFSRIDGLLIGAILGVRAVGLFEAPLRIVALLGYVGQAASKGVAPRVARQRGQVPNVEAFRRVLRYMIVVQSLAVAPVVVWAEPLTKLALGSGYEESAGVLRALAPFILLSGISPVLALGINYLGEARRRIPIAIGAVAINVVIDLTLLPTIGIIAGALATDVAYSFYTAGHLFLCRRMLGIPLRPLARTLFRSLLAASAMGGVLFAFGSHAVPIPWLLTGGALGAVAYCAVLLATREFTSEELLSARRTLVRRFTPSGRA